MRTLFSTAGLHPRHRFDFWHEIACKSIVAHNSNPECRNDFRAEIRSDTIGCLGLVIFENSPMTIQRTARQANVGPRELFICRQMAGSVALEQDGRDVLLEPGDITLIDPLRPYAGQFFTGSRMLVLKVPRASLEARIGRAREMTACSVKPLEAEDRFASAYLALLAAHGSSNGSALGHMIESQVLDCVAMSLGKAGAARTPRMSTARSLVRMKVRAAIEARLADPTLDVDAVAANAGVSRRYAAAVAAEDGTSIMQMILSRRLERCRRALEDPTQAGRTISDIAYGWGFADMTHFGRRFKAAFGATPREYRKLAGIA